MKIAERRFFIVEIRNSNTGKILFSKVIESERILNPKDSFLESYKLED